jgi:hypothetical protein
VEKLRRRKTAQTKASVDIVAGLVLCVTIPLLQTPIELISFAVDLCKVVVRELSPFLLDFAFFLFPIFLNSEVFGLGPSTFLPGQRSEFLSLGRMAGTMPTREDGADVPLRRKTGVSQHRLASALTVARGLFLTHFTVLHFARSGLHSLA